MVTSFFFGQEGCGHGDARWWWCMVLRGSMNLEIWFVASLLGILDNHLWKKARKETNLRWRRRCWKQRSRKPKRGSSLDCIPRHLGQFVVFQAEPCELCPEAFMRKDLEKLLFRCRQYFFLANLGRLRKHHPNLHLHPVTWLLACSPLSLRSAILWIFICALLSSHTYLLDCCTYWHSGSDKKTSWNNWNIHMGHAKGSESSSDMFLLAMAKRGRDEAEAIWMQWILDCKMLSGVCNLQFENYGYLRVFHPSP